MLLELLFLFSVLKQNVGAPFTTAPWSPPGKADWRNRTIYQVLTDRFYPGNDGTPSDCSSFHRFVYLREACHTSGLRFEQCTTVSCMLTDCCSSARTTEGRRFCGADARCIKFKQTTHDTMHTGTVVVHGEGY